jgi:hypothetical protein
MRRRLANHLNFTAECIARKTGFPLEHSLEFPRPSLFNRERYEEYARNTIARYEDLQTLASTLSQQT